MSTTLVLSRQDVARLLDWPSCIGAVESAFADHAQGRCALPEVAHVAAVDGAFHIKSAGVGSPKPYVAVKVNGNFPRNRERNALPTIQGAIVLCDGENGRVLAVLDSIELTAWRTAAATAVAAKFLANPESKRVALIGCGAQSAYQLEALNAVLKLAEVRAFDTDSQTCERFSRHVTQMLGIPVEAVSGLAEAARESDVIVTCTTAKRFFLTSEHLRPGVLVAAVGADADNKQEIDPRVLSVHPVVADVLEQCAVMGDLHHAFEAGCMTRSDVYAQLGEIVCGAKPGRTSPEQIIIFDSTGAAIQDVAVAAVVFGRARERGAGLAVPLGS